MRFKTRINNEDSTSKLRVKNSRYETDLILRKIWKIVEQKSEDGLYMLKKKIWLQKRVNVIIGTHFLIRFNFILSRRNQISFLSYFSMDCKYVYYF